MPKALHCLEGGTAARRTSLVPAGRKPVEDTSRTRTHLGLWRKSELWLVCANQS